MFLATWLVLWRSSNMGAGTTAAVAALFAGSLAGRWWRQLLVVFAIALALTAYFHSRWRHSAARRFPGSQTRYGARSHQP
jgi:membrane protein implicated in regulation of membrane protease activity